MPDECRGVITDDGTLCQIMHAEVSKWNSIQYVLQHLNRDVSEVIAFGDDYNDMEMIEKCGIGVAMSNAVEGQSLNILLKVTMKMELLHF